MKIIIYFFICFASPLIIRHILFNITVYCPYPYVSQIMSIFLIVPFYHWEDFVEVKLWSSINLDLVKRPFLVVIFFIHVPFFNFKYFYCLNLTTHRNVDQNHVFLGGSHFLNLPANTLHNSDWFQSAIVIIVVMHSLRR